MAEFIKIKSVGQGSSYIDRLEDVSLRDLFDGADTGEGNGYLISLVEMTEEDFGALPEFQGF